MPENVTATDSQEAPTTPPQGTGAPANDLAQDTTATQGQQPTPQSFDEDFLKRLDTLDPASLPQSFAEKFVPKAEFTKKTQALAEDRKKFEAERGAIFELARKAISERPVGPTGPTAEDIKRKELMDLAAQGDGEAMQSVIRMEAERLVTPIRTEMTLKNAYEEAVRTSPFVQTHWNEIYQIMSTNPVIGGMAASNGYQGAAKVMIALGQERELMEMRPAYTAAQDKIKSLEGRLAGYERERAAGLPSSTSRAGTTNGRPAAGEPKSLDDVDLRSAWLEAGGSADSFR